MSRLLSRQIVVAGAISAALLALTGCGTFGRPPLEPKGMTGTWILSEAGPETNVAIFDSGQCVLVGADDGNTGLRGFHRTTTDGTICIFENGRAIALSRRGARVMWTPDALKTLSQATWAEAFPVEPPQDRFVGAWRLNPEPDGGHLYVQILATGMVRSSLGGNSGRWRPWKEGALCIWPGGWRDWIAPGGPGFLSRSWPPGASLSADPADTVVARRVGESKFEIGP